MRKPNHEECLMCGDLKIYPALCLVEKKGQTFRVEPKAMQTLMRLGNAGGEPVSKAQLLRDVWQEKAVVEQVVAKTIFQLRQVLEDDPKKPVFIKTLPRLGYVLTPSLQRPSRAIQPRKVRWYMPITFALGLMALAIGANHLRKDAGVTPALVILPTENYGAASKTNHSDHLNVALKSELIDFECLNIFAVRGESPHPDAKNTLVLESALVEGPNGPTLHLQLAHLDSGQYFWSERIDTHPLPDCETIAARIATRIKDEMPVVGCPAQKNASAQQPLSE